ncbi:hydantoinase/oxoprolinase family protein [Microtetraspora fusca]|uniref:hydantoinase/oxoprolinase family protein n=1 Tax=Microtetraspora fusca TaxID=1997 RepID=UPI000A7C45FC|nr:hydantoinase/oxoprolinase family protein [Microtetraspora fusca]
MREVPDPEAPRAAAGHVIAVDVGGTFVDATLCDLATGHRWVTKVLSHQGPIDAFLRAVEAVCAQARITPDQIARIVHGTTLTTNALLERDQLETALVTTAGFESVLEIGRHDSPRSGNVLSWLKPRRPIGRERIFGLAERMSWDGAPLQAPAEKALEPLIRSIADLGVASVAVAFLHSHVNPAHELWVRDLLCERLDGLLVTLSHEVLPQAGEYERTMAAVLNAGAQPVVTHYLTGLRDALRQAGVAAPLYVMASDGGVVGAEYAARFPITTVLSGPAGGANAAARLARSHGIDRSFALDVGGTSSDVSCAVDGVVDINTDAYVSHFPIGLPVLDVHTVGAGGGSIASMEAGRFSVGPRSAGSNPGPAAYGYGGTVPTVTDALAVLGWLPRELAGGALTLDHAAAESALVEGLGSLSGGDPEAAAVHVLRMANSHMANAIRTISTERGRDPREYCLVSFGGGGSLHSIEVARQIGIRKVLVPLNPGVFTTEGLLSADVARYYVRSLPDRPVLKELDLDRLSRVLDELVAEAGQWLAQDGNLLERRFTPLLDMRYDNQGFDLTVPLEGFADSPGEALERARKAFDETHRDRYSYAFESVDVRIVNVRLRAAGLVPHTDVSFEAADGGERATTRRVFFDPEGWLETTVLRRPTLKPGHVVNGPAVVESVDSTVVIPPGAAATVTPLGALEVDVHV